MKLKPLLISLLMVCCLTICAQSISVKSFKALPMDMTAASLEGKRIDQNGEAAALIKVVTSEKGFTFEAGALGVVDSQQRNGEIWVWVPRASRKITILHQQFGVLRDYRYPVEIQSERTYEMVLTTAKVITVVEEEVREQYLAFQITPPDAMLEVNDQMWPVSAEGTSRKLVDFGTYTYRVQAPNYHADAGSVVVNDPENTHKVVVNLKPNFGWIEVPGGGVLQGAAVYIDNALVGKAPCKSGALKSGQHNVRILRDLYEPYAVTVTVNDEQTTTVRPDLTANFARVTLKVDADAEIWVNDERKGIRTWTGSLESGTYKIECRQANYESTTVRKEITSAMNGEVITLEAPKPILGSLNIESTPDFAKIFIDDKPMGETPKLIKLILVGQHELRLTKEGFADYTETVTVTKGERTQVNAKMQASGESVTVKPQQPKQQRPAVGSTNPKAFFVMANAAYASAPQTSFGLTVGSVRKIGWYLSIGTNFNFDASKDYECDYDGNIVDNYLGKYHFIDEQKTVRLSATAGMVFKLSDPLYAYVGAGYGKRVLLWRLCDEDYNYWWAQNAGRSFAGLALDAGVMLHFKGFGLSVGVQSIGVDYLEAKFGIGYTLKNN